MKHKLKTDPQYLEAIRNGSKPFELRRNDRDFKVGDILWLKGWDCVTGEYTGDELKVDVTYILEDCPAFGIFPGYCAMGIKVRPKLPTVEEKKDYVEDLSCLEKYPNLQIDRVINHDSGITIEWSGNIGYGELTLGVDHEDRPLMDTECMGGDFVRALLTLYFLEGNPQWDPRIKTTTDADSDEKAND